MGIPRLPQYMTRLKHGRTRCIYQSLVAVLRLHPHYYVFVLNHITFAMFCYTLLRRFTTPKTEIIENTADPVLVWKLWGCVSVWTMWTGGYGADEADTHVRFLIGSYHSYIPFVYLCFATTPNLCFRPTSTPYTHVLLSVTVPPRRQSKQRNLLLSYFLPLFFCFLIFSATNQLQSRQSASCLYRHAGHMTTHGHVICVFRRGSVDGEKNV